MPYYRTENRHEEPIQDVPSSETTVHDHYNGDTHHKITLAEEGESQVCDICGEEFGGGEEEPPSVEPDAEGDGYNYSYNEEDEMYECGDCEFTTDVERGMRGHYTQVHVEEEEE